MSIEPAMAEHPQGNMPKPQFSAAVDAWRAGSSGVAERMALAIVAQEPNHVDAHRLLQEIFRASRRLGEALDAARRVLELAPRDAADHRRCAELLRDGGDAAGAAAMWRRSLAIEPDNIRALNNLGNLLTGEGAAEEAIVLLTRAVTVRPDYAAAQCNLGLAYARTGQLAQAIDCYRRALESNPRLLEALLNLASAYQRSGQLEAALDCYDRAGNLRPHDSPTLTCRGEVMLALARHAQALASFDAALQTPPALDAALLGRVHALLGLKRPEEALLASDVLLARAQPPRGSRGLRATALLALDCLPEALREATEALAQDPDDAQAFVIQGFAWLGNGTHEAALSAFDAAARLAPQSAKAHGGRAQALEALGRAMEAIDAYHEAARFDPEDRNIFLKSGLMMLRLGNGVSALSAFEQILAKDPDHIAAKEARAMALLALGRHDDAHRAFLELEACAPTLGYLPGYRFGMQLSCCDWSDYETRRRDIAARVGAGERVEVPLSFLAHSCTPEEQLSCARVYVAAECSGSPAPRAPRANRDKLRVGYLSFDFRHHPVAQLTAGLFESHDRSRFETYGLCAALDDGSDLRRRLAAAFDRFEDVSTLSDRGIAERIAALDIDILVDLGGHTLGSRTGVLAYRPAPVQIAFLGYPGTLGAAFVDYIVADAHVIPEEEQVHYAEQVIYLPDSYLPTDFTPPLPAPLPPPRHAAGLPDEGFVFCGFNSTFKITPEVFGLWMRLLRAVPASVLWLRDASAAAKENLAREAGAHGVDPQRLIYAPRTPTLEDHLARLALADVFLDTTPYNAHTTASEALGAAVPVITLRGRTFASRVATSLLHAVDLGHLSASTPAEYEGLALDLARSPAALAGLKSHLHRVRDTAPLFDTVRFCRHLEDAFIEVAARHRRGEAPAPVYVERRP